AGIGAKGWRVWGGEEEELVPLDWATNGEAERVGNVNRVPGDAVRAQLCKNGIKVGGVDDVPARPMPGIRAAAKNLISDGSAAPAEFSAVGVLKDSNFADSLMVYRLCGLAGDVRVIVVLPIEEEIVGARASSVDGEADAIREAVPRRHILNARLRKDKLDRIAGEVRKVPDFRSA